MVPESAATKPAPLLVFLHSWSTDYTEDYSEWVDEAVKRDWIYLQPNFRGPNKRPEACGSKLARQDILDAIDHIMATRKVDASRVYLAGVSGGGHMSLLMAGHHPGRFSAVSAWVGLGDIGEWYRFQTRSGVPSRYAKMIVASLGGAPGASKEIDARYRDRSPVFHLHRIGDLPIDLSAGVRDGKEGEVPIHQTLDAFNVIAKAGNHETIAPAEIDELWTAERLSKPRESDTVEDSVLGREILLRRIAGPSRVTIFDGAHEGLAAPAVAWLEKHRRATTPDRRFPARESEK
ncbi:MAG TPA: prolyl oligopeptidase [Planctomycetaceae bacterium]|nr:prolyl oligopeptidase [Planctomycetaceae bacterium]